MSYLSKIYLRGSFMVNDIQVQGNDYFYMILKAAMNVPGVHINRNDFLRKELSKNFDRSIVDLAIQKNPASAGIKTDTLERIANACIKYESNKVTLLSAAAGYQAELHVWELSLRYVTDFANTLQNTSEAFYLLDGRIYTMKMAILTMRR
jgi:hypothetical protein